jgi:prepilin peptidase CpaA
MPTARKRLNIQLPLASQILLAVLVLLAGVWDIRFRRIPNWLVASGLVLGIALNSFLFEWEGLKLSLLGIGLGFIIYFPLYLLRGMGAGDVKLMMAIGALTGPLPWFAIFIFTGILGGVIAIVLLLLRGRLRKTLWNVGFLLSQIVHLKAPYAATPELDVRTGQGVRLPHGAVIALGAMTFLAVARYMASR